jgi:hypothetical protein
VNLTVTEVCHLVGFASLGSFSVRFKELVGMSPSAYQAETARRGGPPPIPGCVVLMWSGVAARDGLRAHGVPDNVAQSARSAPSRAAASVDGKEVGQ